MCGIITMLNKGDKKDCVNKEVELQLEDQISRGKQGFGMIFIDDKFNIKIERSCEMIKALLDLREFKSKMILLHHRLPTSSDNLVKQTHPIKVSDKMLKNDYYVLHNGIVHNSDEMREDHLKIGFKYTTDRTKSTLVDEFNDSESIAIELAMFIERRTKKIKATCSAAFVVLQVNKKTKKATKVYFGTNVNPLKMACTRGKLRLSSEGIGSDIKDDTMYELNLKTFKITKRKCVIETYSYSRTASIPTTKHYDNQANTGYGDTSWEDGLKKRDVMDGFLNFSNIADTAKEDLEAAGIEIVDHLTDVIMSGGPAITKEEVNIMVGTIKTRIYKAKAELTKQFELDRCPIATVLDP